MTKKAMKQAIAVTGKSVWRVNCIGMQGAGFFAGATASEPLHKPKAKPYKEHVLQKEVLPGSLVHEMKTGRTIAAAQKYTAGILAIKTRQRKIAFVVSERSGMPPNNKTSLTFSGEAARCSGMHFKC